MNQEKPNNTASIIVAVLAIALILGAVYLVNQTFSSGSTTASSSQSSKSSSEETIVITSSSSSSLSSSSLSSSSSSSSLSSSSSSSSSSASSISSSSNSSSSATTVTKDQMKADLTSLAGGQGKFKVIECGAQATIPSCKPGITVSLSVSSWPNLVAGKTYIITAEFASNGAGFTMNIKSIKPV